MPRAGMTIISAGLKQDGFLANEAQTTEALRLHFYPHILLILMRFFPMKAIRVALS
jgi:hypothetical protein